MKKTPALKTASRRYAVSGLLLLLLACAPLGAFEVARNGSYHDQPTGIDFPEELGGLILRQVHEYPEPGLGVSLSYTANDNLLASVYVYDKEVPDIPTGGESHLVRNEAQAAMSDILTAEHYGYYKSVTVLREGQIRLAEKPALSAYEYVVQFNANGLDKTSHVILTGYRGQYLKIRYTFPKTMPAQGSERLARFLDELAGLLE